MPEASVIMTNFTAGVWSPRLAGRIDLQKYFNAASSLENMITAPHGGAEKRPGLRYCATAKTGGGKVRLVAFEFSTVQSYVIEFGDRYCRFYKDQGQIVTSYTAWVTSTAYALGNLVTQGGNYYRCLVAHTSGVFATDLGAGKWVLTDGASDLAYEIPTPYPEADLFKLQFAQSADVLYIAHAGYGPRKLQRSGHTAWAISTIIFPASAEKTITGITAANPGVVTCVGHDFSTGDRVYITSVVGMTEVNGLMFDVTKIGADSFSIGVNTSGYTAYTSGGTATRRLFTTSGDYPSCVAFFEQRLCWGGSDADTQTIWCSQTADYENMIPGTDDDNAIVYGIASDRVNRIRWMVAEDYLLIGTVGGEWRFGAGTKTDAFTPTTAQAKRQSTYGSHEIQAILINEACLFVQRGGRKLREYSYSYEKDKYVAPDLSILAENITTGDPLPMSGITCMDYQQNPDSIVWAIRADGVLLGMTYERKEDVVGWHPHYTAGLFESVAVIPGASEDEIWVSVLRDIGGSAVRYIEYFSERNFYTKEKAFFVDSGLSWDGGAAVVVTGATKTTPVVITAPGHTFLAGYKVRFDDVGGMTELNDATFTVANPAGNNFALSGIDGAGFGAYTTGGAVSRVVQVVSGLDHLIGETVAVCADGADGGDYVVDGSGRVTLDDYYNHVHAGLPYSAKMMPMRLDAGATKGTAQAMNKRISHIWVRFHNTIGCMVGPDEDNLEEVDFGINPDLYNGDKEFLFRGRHESDGWILVMSDDPLPLTVIAIIVSLTTYER